MKVTRKVKIAVFLGILVIGVVAVACAIMENGESSGKKSTSQSIVSWQDKAPQIFRNAGYNKLIESATNISTNNQYNIGKVTNPFGIRDDDLDFIISYFPSNERAFYAAIRMEQTQMKIYYAKTDKEAIQVSNQGEIAVWCLAKAVGFDMAGRYVDKLDEKKLQTPTGRKIDIDIRRKLGWKVLGNHLSKQEMNKICENGGY